MLRRVFTIFGLALFLAACSSKVEDLKSPCVGADGSPCVKRPANSGQFS